MADFIRLRTGEDIENRYSVYGLNCNKSALSWNWSVRKIGKQSIGKNVAVKGIKIHVIMEKKRCCTYSQINQSHFNIVIDDKGV
ncbi:MAG: hypothetical protein MTP17_04225 [Candidatus Midichloria sp.]|nr:MAG: hypothetical protein MTP17_04225 [Candidatus Midichloria sp.]